MDLTALLLSRIQFAFTISFHIIFPAFTIGLAAWLAFLETMSLVTGRAVYRKLFDFWLRIFAIAFGLGVVSGIVMAFQFGTNWSELSRMSGGIQGGLLAYESYTAFALEAAFFGVLMFGRDRVPPWAYWASCVMISLGTNLSSYWILANNSWMQHPVGFTRGADGVFTPTDWVEILFNDVAIKRFVHMILAAYVTTAFCVAATGAWYALRRRRAEEAGTMMRMGLRLAAVLVPLQLLAGHLVGGYVVKHQPSKIAALEGRWHSAQPAGEVLIGWPMPSEGRNAYEIKLPAPVGSLIDSSSTTAREVGILDIPEADRPNVRIVFFTFRIMVGLGLWMLALAWLGAWLGWRHGRLERARWLLWPMFLSFPAGFVATLMGWFTAEVGRQPFVVYGHLRTADALTPQLTTGAVAFTLGLFGVVYAAIFLSGTLYIYRTLRKGPEALRPIRGSATNAKRPLAVPGDGPHPQPAE
ncbi:cytochrome D ubiquinol oxidase subunit I [Methylobacterium sp. GXS13]|uniref:cytochrome ubiquinol oxidase subunit I n=1 Tax=Methylobacterium sp. GXS13 TaxID=1730094 RepID=UPI00071BFAFD|nr:cytochrome ubiquinol oxidase subunit I [Methylobacterium sp. GXS13]KST57274.1 cytochrome D ubiquinol oxidase subunit I [Methylobacterium sp. GXS13]